MTAWQKTAAARDFEPADVSIGSKSVSDHRHLRLLRARDERPSCHTAEQRDELAPPHHSITSSARAITAVGITMPRDCAVLELTTSSNFAERITGNSAGFSPFKTRPT